MKAIQIHATGGPEKLQLADIATPAGIELSASARDDGLIRPVRRACAGKLVLITQNA